MRIGFVRPHHIEEVVSDGLVSVKTISTRLALPKVTARKGLGNGSKGASDNDGKDLGREHVSRKRSWEMMIDYESCFPDKAWIAKGNVISIHITCTEILNRLRQRTRHTFYQGLGF